MDAAFRADALHARERAGVDDVDRARTGDDGHVHALAVLAHRDVVRVIGERNALDHLQRLQIRDVERRLGFVGHVEAAAVGRRGGAMVHLDAADFADHLVRGRINQHHAVAGRVGLDDAHGGGVQRQSGDRGQRQDQRKFGLHSQTL